jgi:hypothetical protein
MITGILKGGLGNQLFQIFAIMAYSIRHRVPFVFPYSLTVGVDNRRRTYWDTLLSGVKHYTNQDGLITDDALSRFSTYNGSHGYQEIPGGLDAPTTMDGYFQSWRYFSGEYSRIYEWLDIDGLKRALPRIDTGTAPTISVHFRVGDYADIQCYHPILPADYYENAIRHIIHRIPDGLNSHIRVFYEGGDAEYVGSAVARIRGRLPSTLVFSYVDTAIPDWQQMLLMSQCDHHVIANSTFSWWGAVFSRNTIGESNPDHKQVCYPSVWYGHQLYYIPVADLFPANWTVIDVDESQVNPGCICYELLNKTA